MKRNVTRKTFRRRSREEIDGFMDALKQAWNKKAHLSFCQLVGSAISGENPGFHKHDSEAMMDMEAVYMTNGFTRFAELELEFGSPKDNIHNRRTPEQILSFLRKIKKIWINNSCLPFANLVSDTVMGGNFISYITDSELMERLRRL